MRPSFWVVNTACVGGWLQTFNDSLFVPSSTAMSRTLEEGEDHPETSVIDYKPTLRNNPEDRRLQQHCGGSTKSPNKFETS